jgi:hypothetical protein
MPSVERPGKKALYVELPDELDAALRALAERRGTKVSAEVRDAIRRHLAYPPPDPAPEPPPAPLPNGEKKKSRKKSAKMP